ncbi:tRNA pseudouridine(55) synthase TruB [bacterium NHP-B]|nr:tRNA pseudouridine(55) synthase TruB [bacterium NHP-B]
MTTPRQHPARDVPPCGWTLIHKPIGCSSSKALIPVKRALGLKKRVGHSGTLDPFACGLLIVCFGRATRLLPFLDHANKEYTFSIAWGTETDTGDRDGTIIKRDSATPSEAAIHALLTSFQGPLMQTPPAFSALKVKGKRAYRLARRGDVPDLKPRLQHIESLVLTGLSASEAHFRVVCNTGTYIRSLAHDMCRALGVLGHLNTLCRTRIGRFCLSDAFSLDLFEKNRHDDGTCGLFFSPQELLDDIPVVEVSEQDAVRLRQGQGIDDQGFVRSGLAFCVYGGQCVALVEGESGQFLPKILLEGKMIHDVDNSRT